MCPSPPPDANAWRDQPWRPRPRSPRGPRGPKRLKHPWITAVLVILVLLVGLGGLGALLEGGTKGHLRHDCPDGDLRDSAVRESSSRLARRYDEAACRTLRRPRGHADHEAQATFDSSAGRGGAQRYRR
jgi:hypothetical protein